MDKKFYNFLRLSSAQEELDINLSKIRGVNPRLQFELYLNKNKIGNSQSVKILSSILQ